MLRLVYSILSFPAIISFPPNKEEMKFQLKTHNDYINQNVKNRTLPLLRKIKEDLESKYDMVSPISNSDAFDF
jgi:hypothetical protein